jgi:hypothetical protein
MSVTLAAAPRYQWQGLSTDTKPTDNRVGINDLYFAYDTGNLYIYSGTTWNLYALGGGGGGGGSAPAFTSSVTATLAASQNNYSPSGYVGGTTNAMYLAAASGGSTITGLAAATAGWVVFVFNTSTTDIITFANLSGSSSSANQFNCPQQTSALLAPTTGLYLVYRGSQWVFG